MDDTPLLFFYFIFSSVVYIISSSIASCLIALFFQPGVSRMISLSLDD